MFNDYLVSPAQHAERAGQRRKQSDIDETIGREPPERGLSAGFR